jgi:hypothetical protein
MKKRTSEESWLLNAETGTMCQPKCCRTVRNYRIIGGKSIFPFSPNGTMTMLLSHSKQRKVLFGAMLILLVLFPMVEISLRPPTVYECKQSNDVRFAL